MQVSQLKNLRVPFFLIHNVQFREGHCNSCLSPGENSWHQSESALTRDSLQQPSFLSSMFNSLLWHWLVNWPRANCFLTENLWFSLTNSLFFIIQTSIEISSSNGSNSNKLEKNGLILYVTSIVHLFYSYISIECIDSHRLEIAKWVNVVHRCI